MILVLTIPRSGTHFTMWLLDHLGVDARFCHARRPHDARIEAWHRAGVKFVTSMRNPWDVLHTSYGRHPDIDLTDEVLDEFEYMDELRKRYPFFEVRVDDPVSGIIPRLAEYCGVESKPFDGWPVAGWSEYESVTRPVDEAKVRSICSKFGYPERKTWTDPKPRPSGPSRSELDSLMETRHAITHPWPDLDSRL